MSEMASWLGAARSGCPALVCFPHAGGGPTGYLRLARRLVPDCAVVRLPGRPPRLDEPPVRTLREAAAAVAEEVAGGGCRPVALWGHSFGAVLAWETAAALCAAGTAPRLVVISGRDAPGDEAERRHLWSDDALIGFLRSQGDTPPEVLDDPEMRRLVVDPLRQDFALLAEYDASGQRPVPTPMVVVGGDQDPFTTSRGLARWAAFTTGRCQVLQVPGGHFFPWQGEDFLLALRVAMAGV